jgi:hypothetical protein
MAEVVVGAGLKVLLDGFVKGVGKIRERSTRARLESIVVEWKESRLAESVHKRVDQARFVKTLWRVDEKLDLFDFYSQPSVAFKGRRYTVEDYESFGQSGRLLLEGTVGQGKSMLLRYLTARELIASRRLPLFVELRTLKKDESLCDHIIKKIELLGLRGLDSELFEHLCEHDALLILLDGFDEIPEAEAPARANEIAELLARHENLRLIVSSRPNTGISSVAALERHELCTLKNNEYRTVLARLVNDADLTNQILTELAEQRDVESLLTTPLMVTLLAVQYRAECRVPTDKIGFFRGLFGLLLYGHDRAKQGYKRERRSKLPDAAMERGFNALCFHLKKEARGSSYSRRTLVKFATKALENTLPHVDAEAFVEDIIGITCLILFDGSEAKFVHKSVQEFHAACFVHELQDSSAQRFYQAMRADLDSSGLWTKWKEELEFLSSLDRIRYLKLFLIPDLEGTVAKVDGKRARPLALELFGSHRLSFFDSPLDSDFQPAFDKHAQKLMDGYGPDWIVFGYIRYSQVGKGMFGWVCAGPPPGPTCSEFEIVLPEPSPSVRRLVRLHSNQFTYSQLLAVISPAELKPLDTKAAQLKKRLTEARREVEFASRSDSSALDGL